MASGSITTWQIEGEKVEVVTDFLFLGSKITADGDCSHEIRGRFVISRNALTNLDSVLKSRDITLPWKVHIVKTMFFPVVTYVCESWTLKKAEYWRIDVFELWCWRTPESPLDSKAIKPVNLKRDQPWIFTGRTNSEAAAAVFWPSDEKRGFIGKVPDAGKDWGQKER